jgi:quinoprotein glucose dehydrogenase
VTDTLIRRLQADGRTGRITQATGNSTRQREETVVVRAKTFVLTGGFTWAPHLLLVSADAAHPQGLANRSGLVGKYLCGHRNVAAQIQLPLDLLPGVNVQHSLVTKQFMRRGHPDRYLRHDLRVWESSFGHAPRLRDASGGLLLGDALLADWRRRTTTGVARIRAYYDVLPARQATPGARRRRAPRGAPDRVRWRACGGAVLAPASRGCAPQPNRGGRRR